MPEDTLTATEPSCQRVQDKQLNICLPGYQREVRNQRWPCQSVWQSLYAVFE
jgi:hypothetical protein